MAVPKKKRYKQVVRVRRSLQKINLLTKRNINLDKYDNFINLKLVSKSMDSIHVCSLCNISKQSPICLNCYLQIFVGTFINKNYKGFLKRRNNLNTIS